LSRVEKLYDFIADQMVDQTEIVNRNTTRLHFMQNRMDMYGATQNDYFKAPTRFFLSNWIPPKAITKYLREVYGLSDGEVRPLFNLYKEKMGKIVLDRYPNIMGREKPSTRKRRFNESKMDRYVDYIINEFIENNIVEDEDEFTGEDFLSFKQGITHLYLREPKLLHFSTDLTLDEFMKGDFGVRVSRIFRERYHINDYNKILLIWKKICGKLLKDYYGNQTINESTDKKEKYSNYIKDILKKTLNFFYEEDRHWVELKCSFDFNPNEDFDYEMLLSTDWDNDLYYPGQYLFDKNFLKFCNDTFAIYEIETINRIYHWFVDFVRNEFKRRESVKDFLSESTDKKNKFYDRIVDHFINSHCEISFFDDNNFNEYGASFYIDIEDNYDEPWVYFANDLKNKIKFDVNSLYRNSDNYQRSFIYHLKNYGLTDIDEVLDVHLLIMKELLKRLEKLNQTDNINESEDKKERFINFVIEDLINSTHFDGEWLTPPYLDSQFKITNVMGSRVFMSKPQGVSLSLGFNDYLYDKYGINEQQRWRYNLFNLYKKALIEKLNQTDNINESDNKKERFIKYVVNDLVGKTDWWDNNTTFEGWGEKNVRIYTPFIDDWISTFALRAANQHQIPFIFSRIKEYCKKMYGSSDEEVMVILDSYKNKVLSEIMNQYSHLK